MCKKICQEIFKFSKFLLNLLLNNNKKEIMLYLETIRNAALAKNSDLIVKTVKKSSFEEYFVGYEHSQFVFYWFYAIVFHDEDREEVKFEFDYIYSQRTGASHGGLKTGLKVKERVEKAAQKVDVHV